MSLAFVAQVLGEEVKGRKDGDRPADDGPGDANLHGVSLRQVVRPVAASAGALPYSLARTRG